MLTETTHTHKPAHKHTDRAAVHTVSQKWFENWKLTKSEREKRWHKFSWKSKQKKKTSVEGWDGLVCIFHVAAVVRAACELVLPLDTLSWPKSEPWRRREEEQNISRRASDSRPSPTAEKSLHFSFECSGPFHFPQPNFHASFPPAFECLTCHLAASECRHATRPAAKICKLDIKNALMKIPPAAKKKKRMKHCLQKALAHFRHN